MADASEQHALTALGKAMRAARERHGISMRGLAARLGYGHSAFGDYEKGVRLPPREIIEAYESVLRTGGELARLRQDVLTRQAIATRGGHPVAQLPAAPPVFVGRERELAALAALAEEARTGERPVTVLVHGQPAVGKTSLALTAAHAAAGGFDTVLHMELSNVDRAVTANAVLHHMLTAVGVSEPDIPASTENRAGLLRSLLAHRSTLILLDNADSVRQLAPLLPGAGRSLVLVTSRHRLADPAIGHHVHVVPLSGERAETLLSRLIGESRCAAEPDAVERIVTACAGLPLALRIAAHRVAGTPDWPIAHYAGRLRDERRRLAAFGVPGWEVRATFDVSYEALTAQGRRLFRRIALVPGNDFGAEITAALLGTEPEHVEPVLDELASASLIGPSHRPGRYRTHDLLRVYAGHRLDADEPAEDVESARAALFAWIIDTTELAGGSLTPATEPAFPGGVDAAMSWLDEECHVVLGLFAALAEQPAYAPPGRALADLVSAMCWYCDHRCKWFELRTVGEHAVRVAERTGDRLLEAVGSNAVGLAYSEGNEPAAAVPYLEHGLAAARAAGDWGEEGEALGYLGLVMRNLGRYAESVAFHRRAHDVYVEGGLSRGVPHELSRVGISLSLAGEHAEALAVLHEGLRRWTELGSPRSVAMTHYRIATAYVHSGQPGEGLDHARLARAGLTRLADPWGITAATQILGVCEAGTGDVDGGLARLHEAAEGFDAVADRLRQAQTLRALGCVYAQRGDAEPAATSWREALDVLAPLSPTAVTEAEAAALRRLLAGGRGFAVPPFH